MSRSVSRIDRKTVKRKIGQSWPDHVDEVMATLDGIDVHGANAETLARVQLAVLMLCEGDRNEIAGLVEMASRDYRDALVGAEFPDQLRWGFVTVADLDKDEQRAFRHAVRRDRGRYLVWLNKDGV